MMRIFSDLPKLLVILLVVSFINVQTVQNAYAAEEQVTFEQAFPDEFFREYVFNVLSSFGRRDRDTITAHDFITQEDKNVLAGVGQVWFSRGHFLTPDEGWISDLTGLEYFTGLYSLTLRDTDMETLDLSRNPTLTALSIGNNNRFTSINITNNHELADLRAGNNMLETLDLSGNPLLTELRLYGNRFAELDISNNPLLISLSVSDNRLTEIDLSNNPALERLLISNNQLTQLDISNNPALRFINATRNNLTTLDISNNELLRTINIFDNNMGNDPNISIVGWQNIFEEAETYDPSIWWDVPFLYFPQKGCPNYPGRPYTPVDWDISVYLDGRYFVSPRVRDGVMYIQMRTLFNNLGATVDSAQARYDFSANIAGHQIAMEVGSTTAYVNGHVVQLQSAPIFMRGAIYVPLIETAILTGEVVMVDEEQGNISIIPRFFFEHERGQEGAWFLNSLNLNSIIRGNKSFEDVGGQPRSSQNVSVARRNLYVGWGVTDFESAVLVILSLYAGGHNAQYLAVHGSDGQWGERGILAWDMARISQVAGWAYLAGYFSMDEFFHFTIVAAEILQSNFDSWVEMDANFVYGSAFWLGSDMNNPCEQLRLRMDAHEVLTQIYEDVLPPWNMDLSWLVDLFFD